MNRREATGVRRRRRRWSRSCGLMVCGVWVLLAVLTAAALVPREGLAEEPEDTARTLAEILVPPVQKTLPDWRTLPDTGLPDTPEEGNTPEEPGADDWRLTLVNPWNPLPEGYGVTLAQLPNGLSVDERCLEALEEMLSGCRREGLEPVVCSAYRTWARQETLFQNQVKKFLAQGRGEEEAWIQAGERVAVPGTSEHQLGLAVDIVDAGNQKLDHTQESTAVQQWLMEHSWEYGFILRYPSGKSEITGIIYEPWHYRFVGKEAAEEMYRLELCLEEYLDR